MKSILSLDIIKKRAQRLSNIPFLKENENPKTHDLILCPDEKWPSHLPYVAQVPSVENEVHYFAQSQVSHSLMNKKHWDFPYHISHRNCQLESGFPA